MRYETIHEEEREGFTLRFSAAPEEDSPEGHFDSGEPELDAEILRKIENGTYAWFIARVEAIRAGITLGADYLGGCCYDSPAAFVDDSGYYGDMCGAAIAEAKATLATLCDCEAT